jgi:outer membrane immunogenic protein
MKCNVTIGGLAVSALLIAAPLSTASAADMALKAPPPPAPAWSWTGFYLGGNVGYSVGRDPTNQTFNQPGALPPAVLFTSDVVSPAGWLGGGQIGYNFQIAPTWLIGIEADFQGAGQKGSSCSLQCGGVEFMTVSQKLDWFGTVRGRLGYVNGDYLWYVTGGGAWAKVESNEVLGTSALSINIPNVTLGSLNTSNNRGGWVFGGGVETRLLANWTAKLEVLYMDLGQITNTYTGPLLAPNSITVSSNIRDFIFRTGVNYKF